MVAESAVRNECLTGISEFRLGEDFATGPPLHAGVFLHSDVGHDIPEQAMRAALGSNAIER